VAVSCPSLPRDLLESELFGHEKGAFTGAIQQRIGRAEMADGGTLFLDEIGDLPLALQPKLLTFLQERVFQRVGGTETIETDVRVIAATNHDLTDKVQRKEFREDLFFRLNVLPINLPPLRERRSDIPALTQQILEQIATARKSAPCKVAAPALSALQAYNWPGNVRELENILERASAFCSNATITADDLPPEVTRKPGTANVPAEELPAVPLDDLEKLAIEQTLRRCGGNKAEAARQLGITEKTIYNKLARFGLR
jgi:DNA-binding NtrC family response regulator